MIYVVNKTDQGVFSPLSASGTAELLYVSSSSPTATSKQSRVASLRNSISERAQRQKAELCQGMLEPGPFPGADTTKTKPSLSSPVLADFRRLCVKFSIFCHLKLKCTAWVLHPGCGKLFGVCSVADSLKFPFAAPSCFLFRTCIIQTQRGCTNVPKWWEERTFLTTMKLLVCLVNTEAAEADLGRHFSYLHPADTYLGAADGYLKSMSTDPIPPGMPPGRHQNLGTGKYAGALKKKIKLKLAELLLSPEELGHSLIVWKRQGACWGGIHPTCPQHGMGPLGGITWIYIYQTHPWFHM